MSDYNKVNIYKRQMQELGLNPFQYSKLVGVPYEVVKSVIYDTNLKGYSMELVKYFRESMLKKHQEIENDLENAKFKAMEVKMESNNLSRKWYKEEYTPKMLRKKVEHISSLEFQRKYKIICKGKEASRWVYWCALTKKIDKVSEETTNEFVEQLYDILVNNNDSKYLREDNYLTLKTNITNSDMKNAEFYKNWYDNFDIKSFMKNNNLDNQKLSKVLNIGYSTACQLTAKTYYSMIIVKRLYDYINNLSTTTNYNDKLDELRQATINGECEKVQELHDEVMNTIVENSILTQEPKVIETPTNELLRKLLINRLTEEEKELIRIFGGQI